MRPTHRQRRSAFWLALAACAVLTVPMTWANKPDTGPGRIILKFSTGSSVERQQQISNVIGLESVYDFGGGMHLVRLPEGMKSSLAIRLLSKLESVEFVEADQAIESGMVRTAPAPAPSEQWWHMNSGKHGSEDADMDSTQAWTLRADASNIIVAVLGSGVSLRHEDLAANIYTNKNEIAGNGIDDDGNGLIDDVHGYDFANGNADVSDDLGQGTALAGIIGAQGFNRKGIDGVCHRVRILPIKILDSKGQGSLGDALLGMDYALKQGATVINGSWEGISSKSLQVWLSRVSDDVVFVVPAGDKRKELGIRNSEFGDNVIVVSASDSKDLLGGTSNYGKAVDIVAPGHELVSTARKGYAKVSGTPLASAQVAGAAALLQANGMTSPAEIRMHLMKSADRREGLKDKVASGRLNLFNALYDATPQAQLDAEAARGKYAGHDIVADELLISFKKMVSPGRQNEIFSEIGCLAVANPFANVFNVKLPEGLSVHGAIRKMNDIPELGYSEPNYVLSKSATPNDARFSSLYGMNNTGQTGGTPDADIDAVEAWDISNSASNVIVAVIDTGVDLDHNDLAANIWTNAGEIAGNGVDDDGNGFIDDVHGFDFANNDANPDDDNSHGSHGSGTIGGAGNNGIGVAGVCWSVQIMAMKFLDNGGSGSLNDALSCVNYATANGARVMSNSWGGGGFSQSMFNAITAAHNKGILFVAAAGNSSNDNDTNPEFPAGYNVPNVISVAASDHNDALASFSSFGDQTVHLAAPGVNILSTTPGNNFSSFSGTSMACPHVSGAAALLMGQNSGLSHIEIKQLLMDTADDKPAFASTTISGGRLNLFKAMSQLGDFLESPSNLTATPVSSSLVNLSWTDNSSDETGFTVERKTGNGSFASIGSASANATTSSDSTVQSGESYTYRVKAFNAATESGYSNEVSVFVGAAISGKVTQGSAGLAGANVSVQENGIQVPPQSASPSLALSDNTTVSDSVTVSGDGEIKSISVSLNLNHAWIGALKVSIVHPDGTEVLLHNLSGNNGKSINTTYPSPTAPAQSLAALNGKGVSGTWSLKVQDTDGFGDTGTLNSWGFTLVHLSSSSATTDGNGNYSVGGLTSGTYTVTPSQGSLTFNPPSSTVTIGPDATGVDFAVDAPSAELSVSQIVANPNQVVAGGSTIVSVTISNAGPGDASAFEAAVSFNGAALQTVSIVGLAVNEQASFNVQISDLAASPDPHTVSVTADSGNAVVELDETNNTASVEIDVLGKPDLIIDVLKADPNEVETGGSTVIRFTVKNVGESSAVDSIADLTVDGKFAGQFEVGTLAAGASSQTFQFTLNDLANGLDSHTVTARADISSDVAEADENNNEKTLGITVVTPVKEGPDLVASSPSAKRHTRVIRGKLSKYRQVNVSCRISNKGTERPPTTSWLRFSIIDSAGTEVGRSWLRIGRLPVGRSLLYRSYVKMPGSAGSGIYTMIATADAWPEEGVIEEIDENNNEVIVDFDY